jgi:hypothetical protein
LLLGYGSQQWRFFCSHASVITSWLPTQLMIATMRESKKLSALLFFKFIYTKVGVEQVCHFST